MAEQSLRQRTQVQSLQKQAKLQPQLRKLLHQFAANLQQHQSHRPRMRAKAQPHQQQAKAQRQQLLLLLPQVQRQQWMQQSQQLQHLRPNIKQHSKK